ncbi:MAG: PEPxxWA-CTERM sorting domain-containing protein [Thermaurantiacus sp.]|nr:PEPxxWA-CTERM sorting domain-containing protein [Thermaurantiacus sp.]MDW8414264.1 PEPxxWA-CTERM sorting domain-containing protein [Thermaurantiacus sp.]
MPMGPNSHLVAFEPIQNNGAGVLPGVRWHYGTHTNENTLFWARGKHANRFFRHVVGRDAGLKDILGHNDGRYIDNVSVPRVIYSAMAGRAVPEPATWGLMIAGFGLVGAALRRRRATVLA